MASNARIHHNPGHKPSREEIKQTIRKSITEGTVTAAEDGATEQYYTPYLLAVGGTSATVGWLVTISQLVNAFCFLKVPGFVSRIGSRKKAVAWLVLLDALGFIPFIILPFMVTENAVPLVLLFYIISEVPAVAANPIWASWMTDLVPAAVRGRYLGFRSTFTGLSNLLCFVGAGLVLNFFQSEPFVGFAIIFGFALVARLFSLSIYLRMSDVPSPVKEEKVAFSGSGIIKAVRYSAVGKFMVFSALFYFSMFLATPFYAVFMLENLGFTYAQFMIVICSEQVARLLIMRFWGGYADRNGNIKVVRLVCMVLPAIPLLWLVSQNMFYLVGVQVLAGVASAGFDLCTPNFIYATAPAGSRIRYIAYFRSLNALAMAFGALVGGYLASVLPPIFGYSMLALFLLSALARALVAWRMLPPVVDIAHKRGTTSEIIYRRRGMLNADAASYGAGWGLLYVPSFKLGGLGRALAPSSKDRHVTNDRSGEGLTARAILALRSRFSGEIKKREEQLEISVAPGKAALHNPQKQNALKGGKYAHTEKESSLYPGPTLDRNSVLKGLEMRAQKKQIEDRQFDVATSQPRAGGLMGDTWMRKAFQHRTDTKKDPYEADSISAQPFQTPVVHQPALMSKIAQRLIPEPQSVPGFSGLDPTRQQGILKQLARQADERKVDQATEPLNTKGILHDRQGWKVFEGSQATRPNTSGDASGMLRPDIKRGSIMDNQSRWNGEQAGQSGSSKAGETVIRRQGLLGNTEAWQKYQAQEIQARSGRDSGTSSGGKPGMLGNTGTPKPSSNGLVGK